MSFDHRQNQGFPPDFLGHFPVTHGNNIAGELAAIRAELRALREALAPPKSAIITGPEVERIFSALKGGTA